MIGSMATWLLVIHLSSPTQPYEAYQWDGIYTSSTAEECERHAKNAWAKYNNHYKGTMSTWMQTFTTTCSATTSHNEYKWFIKCDQFNSCSTEKYKGLKY